MSLPWVGLSKGMKTGTLAVSLALTLMMLFNTMIQPMLILFPVEEIQIQIMGQQREHAEREGTRLLGVNTRYGYIHYTRMEIDGGWQRDGSNILFENSQDAKIQINMRVGPWVKITFRQTPYSQPVRVIIAGELTEYDLMEVENGELAIHHPFKVPFIAQLPFILSFICVVWFLLTGLMIVTGSWCITVGRKREPPAWTWGLYLLPMLLAWGFTLLVFWPGMLSNDAMAQWVQGATGQYNDLQSAFHALLLTGFIQIWNTPGLAAMVQILAFAGIVAWGLKQFEKYGVPPMPLFLISLIFAVSPVYNLAVITLWKDVAYAIAFLWMCELVMLVVLSQGIWIAKGVRWILLGLAGFLVAIFRLNGLVLALIPLVLLAVEYKSQWKRMLGSLLLAIVLFGVAKGPLYSWFKVE